MFAMVGDCQCTCRNGNRSQEQGRTRLPFPCCRIASPAAPAPSSCPPTTPDSPHHRHRHRLSPPPRPPPTYSKLLQDDKRNLFESFPIQSHTARPESREEQQIRQTTFGRQRLVLNRLPVQPGGAAVRRRGSSRRRGGEAAGAAERGHAHRSPRPGGLPIQGGSAPGRAVAGGDVAELPRAAEQAEHLHSGMHTTGSKNQWRRKKFLVRWRSDLAIWRRCLRLTMFSEMRASRRHS